MKAITAYAAAKKYVDQEMAKIPLFFYLNAVFDWMITSPTAFVDSIAVDSDGNVFYAVGNTLMKLNPEGRKLWTFTGYSWTIRWIAVDHEGNAFVSSESNGSNVAKISKDGVQIWSTRTGMHPGSKMIAVDSNGDVFAVNFQSSSPMRVTKIKGLDGSVLWDKEMGTSGTLANNQFGLCVDANGDVYVGLRNSDYRAYKRSGSDGELLWTAPGISGDFIYGITVDDDGYVYILNRSDELKKVDQSNANIESEPTLVWSKSGIAAAHNSLFLDGRGYVYGIYHKLNIATQAEEWGTRFSSKSMRLQRIDANGNLYFTFSKQDENGNTIWYLIKAKYNF